VGLDKTVSRGQGSGGVPPAFGGRGQGLEAVVVAERPSAVYEVVLPTQQKVLAHLVGTVKRNFVRLVPGDRVEVELSPHDPTRGRITRKIKGFS
jgi:translation initiation factor IF-1